jgi:hypothetical protein
MKHADVIATIEAKKHEDEIRDLKRCVTENYTCKRVFLTWKHIRAGERTQTVEEAMESAALSRADAVRALKTFERYQVGWFYAGRRQMKSRFLGKAPLALLYFALNLGETDDVPMDEPSAVPSTLPAIVINDVPNPFEGKTRVSDGDDKPGTESVSEEVDLITHTFRLRPNLELKLSLPINISKAEATRVSTFVTSLPFD